MTERDTKEEVKRITVSLDDETAKMLEALANSDKRSVSEIVRFSVSEYYKLREVQKYVDPEFVGRIVDLLSESEHVMVDVSLWATILEELNRTANEKFWEYVGKIGREYGFQLKVKGLNDIFEVLKYMECLNWYHVKASSSNTYTLILTVRAEVKLLSVFLQNLFNALEKSVELIEGVRKIIVIDKTNGKEL
ncbi:MAG: CopG family transcriptional regulator [Archaeoglobus sp.]|uniref:ribbon-helix-helix protein, CopG family n=1 Tax=Archaeoglobus sp. TaxID=1872626 RepID=UPI001D8EA210|nr:ribbon-helix-helix protein, CopG family [Archaeoglobus sp.]MBO8180157.1 CopG family transcriptional regulator [Archaeoglobus sp.]